MKINKPYRKRMGVRVRATDEVVKVKAAEAVMQTAPVPLLNPLGTCTLRVR